MKEEEKKEEEDVRQRDRIVFGDLKWLGLACGQKKIKL